MAPERFEHEGKSYEIRLLPEGDAVHVRAFHNGARVNRFTYSATVEVLQDIEAVQKMPGIRHLIEIAKQDVIDGLE